MTRIVKSRLLYESESDIVTEIDEDAITLVHTTSGGGLTGFFKKLTGLNKVSLSFRQIDCAVVYRVVVDPPLPKRSWSESLFRGRHSGLSRGPSFDIYRFSLLSGGKELILDEKKATQMLMLRTTAENIIRMLKTRMYFTTRICESGWEARKGIMPREWDELDLSFKDLIKKKGSLLPGKGISKEHGVDVSRNGIETDIEFEIPFSRSKLLLFPQYFLPASAVFGGLSFASSLVYAFFTGHYKDILEYTFTYTFIFVILLGFATVIYYSLIKKTKACLSINPEKITFHESIDDRKFEICFPTDTIEEISNEMLDCGYISYSGNQYRVPFGSMLSLGYYNSIVFISDSRAPFSFSPKNSQIKTVFQNILFVFSNLP